MPFTRHHTAYTSIGEEKKPTVVLIHGLGLHRFIWQPYIEILSKHFHIVSYDLLGHGETKAVFNSELTLGDFSAQLKALLDELHIEQAILVGFSLGGMINRRFAIDYTNRVRALCILNSPHQRSAEQQKLVENNAEKTEKEGIEPILETVLQRWFTADFYQYKSDYIETIRQGLLANDLPAYAAARRVLAKGVLELIKPQPAILLPTLIMTCENDSGSTPAMAHAIAQEMPNSEVMIVPQLKHMGLCENVDAFCEPILEFIHKN